MQKVSLCTKAMQKSKASYMYNSFSHHLLMCHHSTSASNPSKYWAITKENAYSRG